MLSTNEKANLHITFKCNSYDPHNKDLNIYRPELIYKSELNMWSDLKIKINPKDNTITIKKVKDFYDKQDIYKALLNKSCLSDKKSMDKWIEENLN